MENKLKKSRLSTRQMTIIGMLSAISIFLGLTGLGFIPLPTMKATIMHIPVIIGAIVEGPMVGALVGLVFGLFSMYQNFTVPGPTSFIFWNPVIAIIPRILIGLVAYYVYSLMQKKLKKESVSIAVASLLATFTNTAGVLTLAYLFYAQKYASALGINPDMAAIGIAGIGVTNGIPEAIVSAVICIPVIIAILKIKKNRN